MNKDIIGIHYLRAVAASMVVFHHIEFQWGLKGRETFMSGVDIFFIISGFVMVYSTNGGKIGAREFMRRRIVRIAPLYWLLTCLMIAILLLAPGVVKSSKLDWVHAIASLGFVAAENPAAPGQYIPLLTPGWTLNLEILFYGLFAVAISLARGKLVRLLAGLAVPILALVGYGMTVRPQHWVGFYTQPVLLEFLAGAFLGALFLVRSMRAPRWLCIALLLVSFAGLIIPPVDGTFYRPFRFGILALVIVWAASSTDWPEMKWLRILGDSSYSLYLSHFFVLSAVAQMWARVGRPHILIFFATSFIAALLGGIICWALVESRLAAFFRRRSGARRARLAAGQDMPDTNAQALP